MGSEEEFLSDEEVEAYERRKDPARRSVVWSLAALAAVFLVLGGAYVFGKVSGGDGSFLATLFSGENYSEGEIIPLRGSDAGRLASPNISSLGARAGSGVACGFGKLTAGGFESGPSTRSWQVDAVLISEVAWMGTEAGAQYEWVEIANAGDISINIGGWSIVDKEEQIQMVFSKDAAVAPRGFFLLARSADSVNGIRADVRYTGNLKNEDEALRLFDGKCDLIDEVVAAPKWPAGESSEKRTMERNLATRTWYTSAKVGGTPRAQNSTPPLNVSQSETSGEHSASQNVLATTSTPTTTVVIAPLASTSTPSHATTSPSSVGKVLISEVMAGKDGATNWDFVELYNAGPGAADLTGWSMKKRTGSGSESTLVSANAKDPSASFEGKVISAGAYFLLANAEGYTGAPVADVKWPKSYTLAYTNNAVVLYNANGEKADEVSWSEIPKGQSYARVSVESDAFTLGVPTPRAAP